MGRHRVTKAGRRGSAVLAAVMVPAATLVVAGADTASSTGAVAEAVAGAGAGAPCCIEVVTPERPMGASALAERLVVRQVLPVGVAPEKGLQVETILAARAVSGMFPEILNIGGVRSDSMRWHPDGLAIDVMIPNYRTAEGIALGDRIVAFVLDNADRFGLNHALWRQTSHGPGRPSRLMRSRGSDTANHFDHVHIATNGGGYPTGSETYLR